MDKKKYRTLRAPVAESNEALLQHIRNESDALKRTRLMALQLYVSGQCGSYSTIADQLGVDRHSVRSWFARYERGGLDALLEVAPRGNKPGAVRAFTPEAVATVARELAESQFDSYGQIQARLADLCGKDVKYTTVHHLVYYRMKARLKRPREVQS